MTAAAETPLHGRTMETSEYMYIVYNNKEIGLKQCKAPQHVPSRGMSIKRSDCKLQLKQCKARAEVHLNITNQGCVN